ncbi:MAG: hypothetical protein IPJ59_04435 [Nannocystis sp.]|nr:hypothetical protein [Nannocystis sp.]
MVVRSMAVVLARSLCMPGANASQAAPPARSAPIVELRRGATATPLSAAA